ncbi:MAG: hypothetical protein VYA89_05100 [Actinomycetota bacterium]|nr:hypothetical protein [Actinomycetota bacterium]
MNGVGGGRPRIGYVPLHPTMAPPGDRRRFPAFAADRGLDLRVVDGWEGLDVAVLSSEADLVRWERAPSSVQVVLDLPDAFLDEGRNLRSAARGLAKWAAGPLSRPVLSHYRAMCRLIERSDAVVCSTPEQAQNLSRHSDNVHVVLDLHREIEPLAPVVGTSGHDRFDVVWEGLYPTLVAVEPVLPAIRRLGRDREVVLHLVTDPVAHRYMNRFGTIDVAEAVAGWGIRVEVHGWGPEELGRVAAQADLAVVPVDRTDPYTLGTPENRLRIFWRLGLPVLGSESPAHRRACEVAGMPDDVLCVDAADWERSLTRYAGDPAGRLAIAESGHAATLGAYGDEAILSAWDGVFRSLGVI